MKVKYKVRYNNPIIYNDWKFFYKILKQGEKMRINWDQYFMNLVYLIAMRSEDEFTHYGAVITNMNNAIISCGYNGLPRGVKNTKERQERPLKYNFFEHAERNAIYLAKRDLTGYKMYTNGIPCTDCARAIIQSGLTQVLVDREWNNNIPEKWEKESIISLDMFYEANIRIIYLDVELIITNKYCNGEIING